MIRRFLAVAALVGAPFAVAGCGGSSGSTSTSAAAQTTTINIDQPATSTAADPPAGSATQTTSAATGSGGSSGSSGPSAAARAAAFVQPPHVTGPTVGTCLHDAGLNNPEESAPQRYEGFDPTNGAAVFVDGPYTTASAAQSAAASEAGVTDVAVGGLYMVNAALTSRIHFKVAAVASCLAATSGHGDLQYGGGGRGGRRRGHK